MRPTSTFMMLENRVYTSGQDFLILNPKLDSPRSIRWQTVAYGKKERERDRLIKMTIYSSWREGAGRLLRETERGQRSC